MHGSATTSYEPRAEDSLLLAIQVDTIIMLIFSHRRFNFMFISVMLKHTLFEGIHDTSSKNSNCSGFVMVFSAGKAKTTVCNRAVVPEARPTAPS